jgi:hypothetical protein
MALNVLNGSKTEVFGVRVTLFKTVKPTPFRVEPEIRAVFLSNLSCW